MKNLFILALLLTVIGTSSLQAQFGIRNGCLATPVELTQNGTANMRPTYLGTVGADNYFLQWVTPDNAWVIFLNGNPISFNMNDTPTPSLSADSPWSGINQCAGNSPEVVTAAALPVAWLSFDAQTLPKTGVLLRWATSEGVDNQGFHVQKLASTGWSDLGFVSAGPPERSARMDYEFLDQTPLTGLNTYRLAQMDLDGTISISEIATAQFTARGTELTAYPNPTVGPLKFNVAPTRDATIEILDNLGRTVREPSGYSRENGVDISGLPTNLYYVVYRSGAEIRTTRIMKIN